jgi:plastocyanin
MKRSLLIALALVVAAPAAGAAPSVPTTPLRESVPLIAAGGSALTNGIFFPGAAVYDGADLQGVAYEIEKGTDIQFITPDGAVTAGNGHQIRSFKKRKNGTPLFQSKFISDGGSTLMITSHLKPGRGDQPGGSYGYFCTVHYGMYGLLEVTS